MAALVVSFQEWQRRSRSGTTKEVPPLGQATTNIGPQRGPLRQDERVIRGDVGQGGPLEPLPGLNDFSPVPRVVLRPTRDYWLEPLRDMESHAKKAGAVAMLRRLSEYRCYE